MFRVARHVTSTRCVGDGPVDPGAELGQGAPGVVSVATVPGSC